MKSPLKDKPLRNPGESLDKEIDKTLNEDLDPYAITFTLSLVMMLLEWWRWYTDLALNPIAFTIFFLLAGPFCIYKVFKIRAKVKNLKQGRDGEKAVGQYLERLRETGAKVFHDIPGDNFNLDHVVITSSGVYVVETKTYSKPDKGEPTVTFDGEKVTLKERGTYDAPVIQVKAGAHWLKKILKSTTGKDFVVRPVLVFPGWFVQPTAESKKSDVWVLNPKALPTFISNSNPILSSEEVNLASHHLSRHIRASIK